MARLAPIAKDARRSWKLTIDGSEVLAVSTLTLEDPRFGALAYGMSEMGFDTWSFRESGGGGVVSLPFVIVEGALLVGVVVQKRPNQGGEVPNAPRGFLDPDEASASAAARELAEETGLAMTIVALEGEPANPNSTFFDTSEAGAGVRFFAAELHPQQMTTKDGETIVDPRHLQAGEAGEAGEAARRLEAISKLVFIPWVEAARVGDMFTVAGVARLLAHLRTAGRPITA